MRNNRTDIKRFQRKVSILALSVISQRIWVRGNTVPTYQHIVINFISNSSSISLGFEQNKRYIYHTFVEGTSGCWTVRYLERVWMEVCIWREWIVAFFAALLAHQTNCKFNYWGKKNIFRYSRVWLDNRTLLYWFLFVCVIIATTNGVEYNTTTHPHRRIHDGIR